MEFGESCSASCVRAGPCGLCEALAAARRGAGRCGTVRVVRGRAVRSQAPLLLDTKPGGSNRPLPATKGQRHPRSQPAPGSVLSWTRRPGPILRRCAQRTGRGIAEPVLRELLQCRRQSLCQFLKRKGFPSACAEKLVKPSCCWGLLN